MHRPIDAARRAVFLEALRRHGVFVQACREASPHAPGGAANSFRDLISRDRAFAAEVKEALDVAAGAIEYEVFRRATEGAIESKSDGAGNTWHHRRLSDSCLLALARARVPAFREKAQVEVTGAVRHEVEGKIDVRKLTDAQLDAAVKLLDEIERGQLPAPEAEDPALEAEYEIQGEE